MLSIVGGTYIESCIDPKWNELYGSGLRAAAALSGVIDKINFTSCIGSDYAASANLICQSFNINSSFTVIDETICFNYQYPIAKPYVHPDLNGCKKAEMPDLHDSNILLYGLIEAKIKVNGNFVVYDPQNWHSFSSTGSSANHLALVLNLNEARIISGINQERSLVELAKVLLEKENAEVVIIKNGAQGALMYCNDQIESIPLFQTSNVWPIGSGDIFSATFAWKWAEERLQPYEAAIYASKYTAHYCQTSVLPLPSVVPDYKPAMHKESLRKIYLAGPFFTISERWLIEEMREKLLEFGNSVFSPFHDVGKGEPNIVATKDLQAIHEVDVIMAVLSGFDPGTLFEIGYARALGKRVVLLVENAKREDMTMLIGSECEVTSDLSTAVYMASW